MASVAAIDAILGASAKTIASDRRVISRGDLVRLNSDDSLGVVREIVFIQEEKERGMHKSKSMPTFAPLVEEKSTVNARFGIELFNTEADVRESDGCFDGIRYFHTPFGAARLTTASEITKIDKTTLLDVIAAAKDAVSVMDFAGANEEDMEKYMITIGVGDVILSSGRMGLITSSRVVGGEQLFSVSNVIDDGDAVARGFQVSRRDIQRKYRSEELFEVISALFEAPLELSLVPHLAAELSRGRLTSVQICGDELGMDLATGDGVTQTFVLCSSTTFHGAMLGMISGVHMYEARTYPFLMHLRNPNVRIIFLASAPINPAVRDYYFSLAGVDPIDAQSRLKYLPCNDFRRISLTQKVLSRPLLIKRIRRLLKNEFAADEAHLMVWVKTELEQELAQKLGIPLYGPTQSAEVYGSKAGSRVVFRDARVPHCVGTYDAVYTPEDIVRDIGFLLCREQSLRTGESITTANLKREHLPNRLVIKCNEGFSGEGNAIVEIKVLMNRYEEIQAAGDEVDFNAMVLSLFESEMIKYGNDVYTWEMYSGWIREMGCILEVWMDDVAFSPSCTGFGHRSYAKIYATHDQILDGQLYLGCTFPAREKYRRLIQDEGQKIAQNLHRKGVLETFSIDFVVTESPDGEIKAYAVEINVRWGGTTHPMRVLRLLTQCQYDAASGNVVLANGESRSYICKDTIQKEAFIGLLPEDVLDALVERPDLNWNPSTNSGVVVHMLNSLSIVGKCGATCVAPTLGDATKLLDTFVGMLDDLVVVE